MHVFHHSSAISPPQRVTLDKMGAALLVGVLVYLLVWTIPINTNSDALLHLNSGRGIAETGYLLDHQYNTLREPINYPQTHHVTLALLYMWGGEEAAKCLPVIAGSLAIFFLYLLLRRAGRVLALVSSLAALGILTHELIQPYIEPGILAAGMISIYFLREFYDSYDRRALAITLLFLALGMSLKQQGLIVFGAILASTVLLASYRWRFRQDKRLAAHLPLFVIPAILAIAPVLHHLDRNERLVVYQIHLSQLGDFSYLSSIAKEYLLGPLCWQYPASWTAALFIPAVIGLLLGSYYVYRRDRLLMGLLFAILAAEVAVSSCIPTGTLVRQYHVMGLAVVPVLLLSVVFFLHRSGRLRLLSYPLAAIMLVGGVIGIFNYQKSAWQNSGRCDDSHIHMYETVGEYIALNVPEDAVYLAASEGFLYYSLRSGGQRVWIQYIFNHTSDRAARDDMRRQGISHVFVETRQVSKESWWMDYIPSNGLITVLEESDYFRRMFYVENTHDDIFYLYEVL